MFMIRYLLVWVSFILLFTYSEFANSLDYFYFSNLMLFVSYHLNVIKNINMSLQITIVLFNIPSLIFWYSFITYNYFLKIYSISYNLIVFYMFTYFYILSYVFH